MVFLPTVFLEGQAKLLFIPLTFTISFSLFASFLVSRTVTPLLCLRLLKPARVREAGARGLRDRFMSWSQGLFDGLDSMYQEALLWALGHRKIVVLGVLGMFLGSLALVPLIGTEFFPNSDESQFRITLRAPLGTRVEETEKMVARIEEMVRQNLQPGELKSIVSTVGIPGGRSALFSGNTGPHAAQVQVYLATPDQRKRSDVQIVNAIRPRFAGEFPGALTYFNLGGHHQPRAEPRLAESARGRGDRATISTTRRAWRARWPGSCATPRAWPTCRSAARGTTRSSTSWSTARRRRPPA